MKKLKFQISSETKRTKKGHSYEIKMVQACNDNSRILNTTESSINYKMSFKNYDFDISNFEDTNLFSYDNASCCFYDVIDQNNF